jgi:NAD-dependent DNA ligase
MKISMTQDLEQKTRTIMMHRWVSQLSILIAIAIAASLTIRFQMNQLTQIEQRRQQTQSKGIYQREEQQIKEALNLLAKLPGLNFDNLIANWAFLNFLQFFGDDQARKNTGYGIAPSFFDLIVEKDPNFLDIYPYLSASVTLYAGQPQQTVALLEKGAKKTPSSRHPQAYFLWQSKGTDELLFLGRNQDAQRSYQIAAHWAEKSTDSTLHSIAQSSRQTAQFLSKNPDSKRARVGAWFGVLTGAINDTSRQIAVKQIEALGGKVSLMPNGAYQVYLPSSD